MIYSNVSSGAVSITEYFHLTQIPVLAPAQKKAGIRARLHSRQAEPKNIFFGIHSPRSGIRSDKENKSNHICSRFTTTWRQIHTCKSARWQGQQWCLKKRKNRILFFFQIFFGYFLQSPFLALLRGLQPRVTECSTSPRTPPPAVKTAAASAICLDVLPNHSSLFCREQI